MAFFHEIILTFFGCGKSKKAPGSVGSIASLILWLIITKLFFDHQAPLLIQNIFWAIFLISSFIYGCFAIPIYAKKFNQIDHSSIVLDEVVGQILALQITFLLIRADYFLQNNLILVHLGFCYISFRFFDIVKPSFIGTIDRKMKNGFGVMFDDLVCGIITAIIGCGLIYTKSKFY